MTQDRIKIRAVRSTGELEIEGPAGAVQEWWDRLWPELGQHGGGGAAQGRGVPQLGFPAGSGNGQMPDLFGEYFTEFRSDITDVDKILVAASFIQGRDPERVFATKGANQALIDQNIKVANASENVRRLIQTKRVFVVSDGKYRVSAGGLEHLNSLKVNP